MMMMMTYVPVHRNVCVLTSLQTEESRGYRYTQDEFCDRRTRSEERQPSNDWNNGDDPINRMRDRQITNLRVETDLVATRGASFRSNRDF